MKSAARVFWPLASVLLLADCTSKRAIEDAAPLVGVPVPVVGDFLRFTLVYNEGAAFSTYLGPYQRWVLIGLVCTILVILARSYRRITELGRVGTTGLGLVAGGAAGNLLDRIISERGVVDFIDVGVGENRFYLFNIADAGVAVGAVLLAFALWRSDETIARPPDVPDTAGA